MTTQDCLTYLLEALALTFTALVVLDFATGLPGLLNLPARSTPNPLDMAPIFKCIDSVEKEEKEISLPLVKELTEATLIADPWTLPTPLCTHPKWLSMGLIQDITPQLALPPSLIRVDAPNFNSMTRETLADMAKKHGIQHYRPGVNRRKSKQELIKDLQQLQLA